MALIVTNRLRTTFLIALTITAFPSPVISSHSSEKPSTRESYRQLREELIHLFDTCMHTLFEEMKTLNLLSSRSTSCCEALHHLHYIQEMKAFFKQGTIPLLTVKKPLREGDTTVTIQDLIHHLIETEQTISLSIRDIIEESPECCFYRTRSKEVLKKYQDIVQDFIQESRTFNSHLHNKTKQLPIQPISPTKE